MITDEQIVKAKKELRLTDPLHEHNDCVRIAYEWLDAQKKTKHPRNTFHPIKHLVEQWGGRYVSQSDVEIAAHLHPQIVGKYPYYNISSRLTEPAISRLKDIGEAFAHNYREEHNPKTYKFKE